MSAPDVRLPGMVTRVLSESRCKKVQHSPAFSYMADSACARYD